MGHLYVIRHGQTTCNADQIIQGPRIDAELSEAGKHQAASLGRAFADTPLDGLITSPMRRARDTAALLLSHGGHHIAPQVAPELYEIDFGDLCGQRIPDVRATMEQVEDAWGLGFVDQAFPGGESPVLAQHRIRPVLKTLAEHKDHDLAVVAHGRINKILLASLLGQPLTQMGTFGQDNANVTHLEWMPKGPVLRRQNDTSHL